MGTGHHRGHRPGHVVLKGVAWELGGPLKYISQFQTKNKA